jgi:hypothetical protein
MADSHFAYCRQLEITGEDVSEAGFRLIFLQKDSIYAIAASASRATDWRTGQQVAESLRILTFMGKETEARRTGGDDRYSEGGKKTAGQGPAAIRRRRKNISGNRPEGD